MKNYNHLISLQVVPQNVIFPQQKNHLLYLCQDFVSFGPKGRINIIDFFFQVDRDTEEVLNEFNYLSGGSSGEDSVDSIKVAPRSSDHRSNEASDWGELIQRNLVRATLKNSSAFKVGSHVPYYVVSCCVLVKNIFIFLCKQALRLGLLFAAIEYL